MGPRATGLVIVAVGIVVVVIGLLVASGGLGWFGRLPGDIRWRGGRTQVFFPLTSMLVLSIGLSLLIGIVRRFF
jgi:Protein of unknown function (DUF2905)